MKYTLLLYYIIIFSSRFLDKSRLHLDKSRLRLDNLDKNLDATKSRPRKKKVDLDVMDNLDRFQKLVSTRWTISISIGLERRDPQAYWNSLDQNCVFSVDWKFHNQLTKFFRLFSWSKNSINCQNLQVISWHLIKILIMSFWLILNFWSTAKKEPTDFGTWSKVDKKPKIPLLELSINCQKITCKFWHLIETF